METVLNEFISKTEKASSQIKVSPFFSNFPHPFYGKKERQKFGIPYLVFYFPHPFLVYDKQ